MKTKSTLIALLIATGSVSAQAPVKKVMLEEFTTTLCGMCPPQTHAIHTWYENHSAKSILMTHHAGFGTDAMTTTEASTYASYFQPSTFGFAPAIMIDRDVYPWRDSVAYMSVGGFDSIALRVSNNPADVAIAISGSYNAATRQISLTTTSTFANAVASGAKRLHLYVLEDSLVGTGSGWDQKCYSSSFANTYYPGQYNSSTSMIEQFPHRNVQRGSMSGGAWGITGVIPNSPVVGTPYTSTITYTLPASYNSARISIVAMVANYGPNHVSREVLNANSVELKDLSTSTGVAEQPSSAEINAMYPNPAVENVTLSMTINKSGNTSITVSNLMGQQVAVFEKGVELSAGRYEATFSTAELSSGLYMISIRNGEEVITSKLSVEK